MKKITTTAGFLALGAASLQAAVNAPAAGSPGAQKPWSVSATLRGFYDDNYNTGSKNSPIAAGQPKDSFGIEVSPSLGFNIVHETTTVGLNYVYSMRWFEARPNNSVDHMHQVNGKLSHAFSERFKTDVTDSFVVAQEPAILDPTIITVPIRSEGDNKRNILDSSLSAKLMENTDLVVGYQNTWYDYQEATRSALLDRIEHLPRINLRQVILPQTVGVLGYQFGSTEYTAKNSIAASALIPVAPGIFGVRTASVAPRYRDNYSHYFYAGVDQQFTPTLNGSVRVGAQYLDYHETASTPIFVSDPFGTFSVVSRDQNQWSPYVDANVTWTYTQGSYLQLGVRHQHSPTDIGFLPSALASGSNLTPTLDSEATTVYGSLNHQITAKLVGSLIGQYQHATFQSGGADNFSDDFWLLGANVTYEINKFLAAEAGYNFDHLDSDLDKKGFPRSYDRNRVYIGIKATY